MKIFFAAVCLLLTLACGQKDDLQIENVVLVTLDTTRADAIGAYGNRFVQTPVLDELAEGGHLFEKCYTHAPITLPSHCSIMTGKIPTEHGVHNNVSYVLANDNVTLAELLNQAGFATGAFISSFILDHKFGLDQGFDIYEDRIVHYAPERKKNEIVTRRAEQTIDLALEWMQHQEGPFFSWIHLYDAHWPYNPPLPFRQAYADNPYFGELAYVDYQLGRLVRHLKQQGIYEKTLIVVTGDHGESFKEHGENTHGFFCYGATTHVPLILSQPIYGTAGQRFSHRVASTDLFPSTLKILGLKSESTNGFQLDSRNEREIYAEAIIPQEDFYLAPVHSIKDDQHSFYYSSTFELYDTVNDPLETINLVEQHPDLVRTFKLRIEQLLEQAKASETTILDQESIELLRSLGYVADGGVSTPGDTASFTYKSPLDSVKMYSELMYLRQFEKSYPFKTIEGLRDLVKANPEQVILRRDLGRHEAMAGHEDEAILNLKQAATLRPEDARLHTFLGLGYHRFGHFEKSIQEFNLALTIDEDQTIAFYNMGLSYMALDDVDLAVKCFEKVLERNPEDIYTLSNLAFIYLEHIKDLNQASQYIDQAIALNDHHPLILANKAAIDHASRPSN